MKAEYFRSSVLETLVDLFNRFTARADISIKHCNAYYDVDAKQHVIMVFYTDL